MSKQHSRVSKGDYMTNTQPQQLSALLVRYFLRTERHYPLTIPCVPTSSFTYDKASTRLYLLEWMHGVARVLYFGRFVAAYLADLEGHSIRAVIGAPGGSNAPLTAATLPSLAGHQWALAVYPNMQAWRAAPMCGLLAEWFFMEYFLLVIRHLGALWTLKTVAREFNALQQSGKGEEEMDKLPDKMDDPETGKSDKSDKSGKSAQDDTAPKRNCKQKYLLYRADRVDLPVGVSLNNSPDGIPVEGVVEKTVSTIQKVTETITKTQSEGGEATRLMTSVTDPTAEELLDTKGMEAKYAVAERDQEITCELVLVGVWWLAAAVLLPALLAMRNLHLLVSDSYLVEYDLEPAETTAVSVALVCLLPLTGLEAVVRLASGMLMGLFGNRKQLYVKALSWTWIWLLEPVFLFCGLGTVWATDIWLDTKERRMGSSYSNAKWGYIMGFVFLILAWVAAAMHRMNLHNKSRFRSGGLHPMLKLEHRFDLVWQLGILIGFGWVLLDHGNQDYERVDVQCDPTCVLPAMRWFSDVGLEPPYSQAYLGPVHALSTDLYNKTMNTCQAAGHHIPSLGEDCAFSEHFWALFASLLCLSGLTRTLYGALLDVRSGLHSEQL